MDPTTNLFEYLFPICLDLSLYSVSISYMDEALDIALDFILNSNMFSMKRRGGGGGMCSLY